MSNTEELISRSQQGDGQAREQLVTYNSGLIWSVAKRFIGRGVETDDLYQLGCIGFLKAIDGFDTAYGTQFSTYAVPKIAGEIRRFLRDDGTVKVSRSIKERATAIKTVRHKLVGALGREPTVQEIAVHAGLTIEEIAIAESATSNIESIHQTIGEDGFSLESILTDTESEEMLLERVSLRQAIEQLPKRDAMVIQLRYFHGLTQEKTSKVLHVSQVQISRIEKKALAKLKEFME